MFRWRKSWDRISVRSNELAFSKFRPDLLYMYLLLAWNLSFYKNFRIGIRPHRDSTPNSPTIPAGSLYHLERGSGSFLKQLLRKFEVRFAGAVPVQVADRRLSRLFLKIYHSCSPSLPSAHLEFLRYYMRSTYLVWLKQPCGRLKVRDCERGGIAVWSGDPGYLSASSSLIPSQAIVAKPS